MSLTIRDVDLGLLYIFVPNRGSNEKDGGFVESWDLNIHTFSPRGVKKFRFSDDFDLFDNRENLRRMSSKISERLHDNQPIIETDIHKFSREILREVRAAQRKPSELSL